VRDRALIGSKPAFRARRRRAGPLKFAVRHIFDDGLTKAAVVGA
jgi:hypothetical protein